MKLILAHTAAFIVVSIFALITGGLVSEGCVLIAYGLGYFGGKLGFSDPKKQCDNN